jgi:pilus assembly protein Flp/PilA
MSCFFQKTKLILRSEDGPTSVEYAVLIAVICIAAIGALSSFGVHMDALYTNINSTVPSGGGS